MASGRLSWAQLSGCSAPTGLMKNNHLGFPRGKVKDGYGERAGKQGPGIMALGLSHLVWRGGEGGVWLDRPTRGPSPARLGEQRRACGAGAGRGCSLCCIPGGRDRRLQRRRRRSPEPALSTRHRTSALTSSCRLCLHVRKTLTRPNLTFPTHVALGNGPSRPVEVGTGGPGVGTVLHATSSVWPEPASSHSALCALRPVWLLACRVVTLARAPGPGASVGQLT